MASDREQTLQAMLFLKKGTAAQVGETRIALLAKIADLGSIAAAAKSLGLSYKGAWDAVQALNNLSKAPLVIATAGGRSGGVAEVTQAGRALICVFETLEAKMADYMAEVDEAFGTAGKDAGDLLRRVALRTTAQNAYVGTVTDLRGGAVNTEVTLRISDQIDLVANVTRESVESLGLNLGSSAVALIKSSFVLLASGHESLRISARNCLKGLISDIRRGSVNDEICLDIGEGKSLTATITRESSVNMGLEIGQSAQALIKASHIILALD